MSHDICQLQHVMETRVWEEAYTDFGAKRKETEGFLWLILAPIAGPASPVSACQVSANAL